MPKLRLELFRYGSLVFGRVLEQTEELRASPVGGQILEIENDFSIHSRVFPAIIGNQLLIRGYGKGDDDAIFCGVFRTDLEAASFCKAVQVMVDRINGEPESNSSVVKVM